MTKTGKDLLNDSILNRGTGFSLDERRRLKLTGLLPARLETLEQQVQRVVANCERKSNDLERYIFLMALQDQNETLFYNVVLNHLRAYMPIIYTPTVGQAAQEYGAIFRRPRGLYVTANDKGHVADILRNWPEADPKVIVATDGGRVLGLGDLGANGMSISVGKLALYVAAGGIQPASTLPIVVDVGTDNEDLRTSDFYLGLRQPRPDQDSYLALMDEFVAAVAEVFPDTLLQFEDLATGNAIKTLARYRDKTCMFNDDIQGTAGVTLAGLMAALRLTGGKISDQTILFVGAGSANTGIGDLIAHAIAEEGFDLDAARKRLWFMDSKGVIVKSRATLKEHTIPYAHDHSPIESLVEAIEQLRPTVLIGATGARGIFDQTVVEAMARIQEQPVIFALSNPTSRSEVTAEQVYTWSKGRAVFASGSPFDPVTVGGKTFVPGQSNNVYIFPGIGLGVTACKIRYLSDAMFLAAARAVASSVTEENLAQGRLFPKLDHIREVSLAIAEAISRVAFAEDVAGIDEPKNLKDHIAAIMFYPDYQSDIGVSGNE